MNDASMNAYEVDFLRNEAEIHIRDTRTRWMCGVPALLLFGALTEFYFDWIPDIDAFSAPSHIAALAALLGIGAYAGDKIGARHARSTAANIFSQSGPDDMEVVVHDGNVFGISSDHGAIRWH
ncbi:MAG: hypothetical protein ACJKTH_01140 [Patescibacteria group bacterium UBA2163]